MKARIAIAISLAALMVPGCLIISNSEHTESDSSCRTECRDYTVCETQCDDDSCYDECTEEVSCSAVCNSANEGTDNSSGHFNEPDYCYSDVECDEGRICIDNVCTAADTDDRGSAGLCQTCESQSDCAEDGALCLGFLDDEDEGPVETICGRPCSDGGDCPDGFVCISVGDAGDSDQCVPEKPDGEVRTCSAGEDLECVVADDCANAEQCVDNECQPPSDADCTSDGDCGDGQVCESYQCVDDADSSQCVTGDDCADHEECVDGECVRDLDSCVFNADCDDDYRCVDGACTPTCEVDEDCGTSERCRENICEFIECYQTSDCSPGNICIDASCETACDDNGDCSQGFVCADLGYCEPDPNVECRSSAECAPQEECSPDGTCEPACTCNDDCSGDDICSSETGICQQPESEDDIGVECS